MSDVFFNPSHPGIAYGDGELQGPGEKGQFVKLIDNDLFQVVSDADDVPVGVIYNLDKLKHVAPGATDRNKVAVYMDGGIYETDNITGTITADDDLTFDPTNANIKTASEDDTIVGKALAVEGNIVKFKLAL
ncbi:hypothetical protein HQ587_06640 [bacterium]|nr:hypothetical protein [bacterium]